MRVNQILLSVALILFATALFAQNYSIEQIPDSLKEDADAVFILDQMEFEIIHSEKSIIKSHEVIAILNSNAKKYAEKYVGYDKLSKITKFEARIYSADGKLIDKSKKSDIYDRSSISGFSIYEDNRVQYLDGRQSSYPYIIEYIVEKELDFTYSIPNWYVLPGYKLSVLESNYSVTAPIELFPQFKLLNTDEVFDISESEGRKTASISFSNIKADEREPYGLPLSQIYPVIYGSPYSFTYDGHSGDMKSWESYGKWQLALNKGRNDVSPETIANIKQLTAGMESDEEKARAVYEFVQNKTRYVSIQLGIGGMQPFPASTVDQYGYGDCKALSNYTQSLLSAIDVESYYTYVYGGDNPRLRKLDEKFTMDVFNHIILCVPNQGDTLWLECTVQTNPFGYQGDFTGDRDVLLITPDGGKIAHTTVYDTDDNQLITQAHIQIKEDGNAMASYIKKYTGLQYENGGLNWKLNDGNEELKKWIYKNSEISDFQIIDFSFDLVKDRIPSVTEKAEIEIHKFASGKGKRLFIEPNLMNAWEFVPKRVSDRKTDMILETTFLDSDSIVYEIPEKYHIEYLPEDIEIKNEFGSYKAHFEFENHQLIYTRRLAKNRGRFPKESYDSYRSFCEALKEADHKKVVFIDKT